jgi:hypothetical protein
VEPPAVKQAVLAGVRVQVGDAADHEPARQLVGLFFELNTVKPISATQPGDPALSCLVIDGVGVLNRHPAV